MAKVAQPLVGGSQFLEDHEVARENYRNGYRATTQEQPKHSLRAQIGLDFSHYQDSGVVGGIVTIARAIGQKDPRILGDVGIESGIAAEDYEDILEATRTVTYARDGDEEADEPPPKRHMKMLGMLPVTEEEASERAGTTQVQVVQRNLEASYVSMGIGTDIPWYFAIRDHAWASKMREWGSGKFNCRACGLLTSKLESLGRWGCFATFNVSCQRSYWVEKSRANLHHRVATLKTPYGKRLVREGEENRYGEVKIQVRADHIPPSLVKWEGKATEAIPSSTFKCIPSELRPIDESYSEIASDITGTTTDMAQYIELNQEPPSSSSGQPWGASDGHQPSLPAYANVRNTTLVFHYDAWTLVRVGQTIKRFGETGGRALEIILEDYFIEYPYPAQTRDLSEMRIPMYIPKRSWKTGLPV